MAFDSRYVLQLLTRAVRALLPGAPASPPATSRRRPAAARPSAPRSSSSSSPSSSRDAPASATTTPVRGLSEHYRGDYRGPVSAQYAPHPDGRPDPGEIVWTWVPYQEDYSQGKDRPVLLVGRNGDRMLGLMLTSRDHSSDTRNGDDYLDIGSGPWDSRGRPSEAKLDRILQVDPRDMRREGAILDARRFDAVVRKLADRTAR